MTACAIHLHATLLIYDTLLGFRLSCYLTPLTSDLSCCCSARHAHPEGHKIKAVDITVGQALQISALFVLSVCVQRADARVSRAGRGAGVPALCRRLSGVALSHRSRHRQPEAQPAVCGGSPARLRQAAAGLARGQAVRGAGRSAAAAADGAGPGGRTRALLQSAGGGAVRGGLGPPGHQPENHCLSVPADLHTHAWRPAPVTYRYTDNTPVSIQTVPHIHTLALQCR